MKFVKTLLITALLSFAVSSIQAQDLKFGHLNSQELVAQLPEKIAADKTLQSESQKLQDQIKVMSDELEKKYQDYLTQRDSLPELIRATKEKDIQDLDERIKNFNRLAQQSLSNKEQELLMPIIQKVQKAIETVGAENKFTYIFDISTQVILYHSDKSTDVSDLVKAKLASTPAVAAPTAPIK